MNDRRELPEWLQRDAELAFQEMRIARWRARFHRLSLLSAFVGLVGVAVLYAIVAWQVLP